MTGMTFKAGSEATGEDMHLVFALQNGLDPSLFPTGQPEGWISSSEPSSSMYKGHITLTSTISALLPNYELTQFIT